MPEKIEAYECSICKHEYQTFIEAYNCEQRGFAPSFKIGDIVTRGAGFGWFNGDRRWIANPKVRPFSRKCPNGSGNCFDECCTYKFYYVVTFVDGDERDGHRPRYHVWTGAMTGSEG